MKILKYIGLLVGFSTLLSCTDFLKERSQDTYYVTSYKDLDELLIGDCYLPIKRADELAYTTDPGYFIHYLADEIEEQNGGLNSYDKDNKEAIFGYFTWQQRVGETYNHNGFLTENSTWKEVYRLLNVANNIIDCVKDVPQNSEEAKLEVRRVDGEAHFLRAAYYFWLVNFYAKPYTKATAAIDLAVPIKTNSMVKDILYFRNTVQEVYDQILVDLKQAESDLSVTPKKNTIFRADIITVNLLLSRVYLYMQEWKLAKEYADKVLKVRSELINLKGFSGSFLSKTSVEILFTMGGCEIPCSMCNYYQSFRVSHDLYDAYSENDLRKNVFWWKYNDFIGYVKQDVPGSVDVSVEDDDYYERKFHKGALNKQLPISDRFLFRTAEAYLNKAEAEAYLGNEQAAREALNILYNHRYVGGQGYTAEYTGDKLVEAIRKERRLELALEGHRWFDLRRYAVCSTYPESKKIVHDYTYYEDDTEMKERHRFILEAFDKGYTLPIPQEVIEFNTGMSNNERPVRSHTVVSIE